MNVVNERIIESINKSGLSLRDIEAKTGISHTSVMRYANGRSRIPIDKLIKIAEALRVNTAYLMGWIDDPNPNVDYHREISSPKDNEIVDIFKTLSEGSQEKVLEYALLLRQAHEKK